MAGDNGGTLTGTVLSRGYFQWDLRGFRSCSDDGDFKGFVLEDAQAKIVSKTVKVKIL